jgi:hypothetical protein
VIEKDGGWFWCSLSLVKADELIGPFPSQQEDDYIRASVSGSSSVD